MAINLTIVVADITATLVAGYTHIKIYRSAEQLTGFTEITIPASIVPLVPATSTYTFTDVTATTKHWYRTTFFDNNDVVAEAAQSTSFLGTFEDVKFTATYQAESDFTSDDFFVIDQIRLLTGDPKELTRDVVSEAAGGFDSVSLDGRTHTLSNPRGWPLSIQHNELFMTTASGAVVKDYQFVTLSGTLNISSGSTDSLDIWYYHFRKSDAEILTTYNALTPPPLLTTAQVSFELATICVSIDLLSSELRLFGATSASEVDIFQEIRINPKGGLDSRLGDLKQLRERKDKLIEDILTTESEINICGVLID